MDMMIVITKGMNFTCNIFISFTNNSHPIALQNSTNATIKKD